MISTNSVSTAMMPIVNRTHNKSYRIKDRTFIR